MACLSPIWTVNPKYKGVYREVFLRGRIAQKGLPDDYKIPVPCGKCVNCRKSRAFQWQFRLLNELNYGNHKRAVFFTGTIDDEHMSHFCRDPSAEIRKFLDRFRKSQGHSVKHWLINEYAPTSGRLHYHGILYIDTDITDEEITALWKNGYCYYGYVNSKTTSYVVKYMLKDSERLANDQKLWVSPGLGRGLLNNFGASLFTDCGLTTSITLGGIEFYLPRYYRLKVFSDQQRQSMCDALIPPTSYKNVKFSDPVTCHFFSKRMLKQIEKLNPLVRFDFRTGIKNYENESFD